MQIHTDRKFLADLKSNRHRKLLPVPEEFQEEEPYIDPNLRYGISDEASIKGMCPFQNRPMMLTIAPQKGELPHFSCNGQALPLLAKHVSKGSHNIKLGEIKIIEHPLSMLTAYNLNVDFSLSEPAFPIFNYCTRPFVDAISDKLVSLGPTRFFTVKEPFAVFFPSGGYFILEPDEGDCRLDIDHQISYPGSVGNQRIRVQMTPPFFNFLCYARTPSFKPLIRQTLTYTLVRLGIARMLMPISIHNVLFTSPWLIHNPRKKFLYNGHNYEFILHELMDITSWLKFVDLKYGGKFVGKLTCHLFGHNEQVDATFLICEKEEFEKQVGMTV